jgi:hypothetical protein
MPSRILSLFVLLVCAVSAGAFVHDRSDVSPLADLAFITPALEAGDLLSRVDDLPPGIASDAAFDLAALGYAREAGLLDRRGNRWGTLLVSMPLIPGAGAGNTLSWDAAGAPVDDAALADAAWTRLTTFLDANRAHLRIDSSELEQRSNVVNGGELVQFSAQRGYAGLPVRGATFAAVVNNGNVVLLGVHRWGDIQLDLTPRVAAAEAARRVERFVTPLQATGLRAEPSLAIVPAAVPDAPVGAGWDHRLVWVVEPRIPGDIGQWEGLVDAHSGELLAFQDLNHYGTARVVEGGVFPVSYDGILPDGVEVPRYPMPYADLSSGGFTDSGGNFSAAGNVTTTLNGQFIRIQEFCGAISESSTGDIDLGVSGGTDCTVPPGHSAGDTHAARSGFYELNRIKEIGRGQLPANAWLQAQLTAQMNISPFCNAFWTGSLVQFFSEAFPCANTGQLAGVFDHEWGHGMDDNDVNGSIPGSSQGGGEGMADIYAALRLDKACVGRGFFLNGSVCGGYGDPCTPASGCTGIRSIDFADRTSGVPHDLTWVRANCGSTTHCLGAAYSETVWDLLKRDLPTVYGMDNNTALEVATRLTYIGAGNASGWFTLSGPPPGAAGCGATQAYLQYLAADDDDGNVANGTPHMTAIAAAFDRHQIGCTPANGGPVVQDSGCATVPTTAPNVSSTSVNMGAELSWAPIAGATRYKVFRTDGEHQCDFGKTLVGTPVATSFIDDELKNGREYYYVVAGLTASDSCMGPASPCETVIPGDGIFNDGFESGDTSAWDTVAF